MTVTEQRLSLEQFLQLPEGKPALEYEHGMVLEKMSPVFRHGALQGDLVELINARVRHQKIARAFPEVRATFAGFSRVPDVVVYRWARIPVDETGEFLDDNRVPPDIAIEIVSPGQSVNALVRRCLWYVANGVEIALLVDSTDRSVLAFRVDQPVIAWYGTDRIDISAVVPEFELSVEQLFESLRLQ